MDNLEDVLRQVRERVTRYRDQGIGEQNTKAALIVPVLRGLGWDVEDLDEVRLEYKPKPTDNPVDYALFILRTPRLFVEAKALGSGLDDRRWANQIMGYAAVTGVEWVVLTDGDEYRIYNSHAAVPIEEKLFRATRVSDPSGAAAETLRLLSKEQMRENLIDAFWEAHFVDRRIRTAIEQMFSADPDDEVIDFLHKRVPRLSQAQVKAGLTRLRIRLDFPLEPGAISRPLGDTNLQPPTQLPPQPPETPPPTISGQPNLRVIGSGPLGKSKARGIRPKTTHDVTLSDLIDAGILSAPLDLEAQYRGHRLTARVMPEGLVICQGQSFETLSAAANVARTPILGYTPTTNGWTFWQFKDVDGKRRTMSDLRDRFYRRDLSKGS